MRPTPEQISELTPSWTMVRASEPVTVPSQQVSNNSTSSVKGFSIISLQRECRNGRPGRVSGHLSYRHLKVASLFHFFVVYIVFHPRGKRNILRRIVKRYIKSNLYSKIQVECDFPSLNVI